MEFRSNPVFVGMPILRADIMMNLHTQKPTAAMSRLQGVAVSEKSPENKERPNASEKKPVDRKLSEQATKALGGAAIKKSGKK
jgi:hypothetical protein